MIDATSTAYAVYSLGWGYGYAVFVVVLAFFMRLLFDVVNRIMK